MSSSGSEEAVGGGVRVVLRGRCGDRQWGFCRGNIVPDRAMAAML